jgi:molecular chaperone GrpE
MKGATMSQTDRPEDQTPLPPDETDAALSDTGEWPAPETSDELADSDAEPVADYESLLEEAAAAEREAPAVAAETSSPTPAPAAPMADSAGAILQAISGLSSQLEQRLAGLQTLFDREIRAEATRERIVDRLHAELQDYKQDLLLKVQRPMFVDLIQLHDDIGKMIDAQSNNDADRSAGVKDLLGSIRTGIEDILYRQGVEPFTADGDEFDPRRQRSVNTVQTEDPERNKTIANRLRPGFQSGDRIIRPEIVTVYVQKK